jgi:hypothetical protein
MSYKIEAFLELHSQLILSLMHTHLISLCLHTETSQPQNHQQLLVSQVVIKLFLSLLNTMIVRTVQFNIILNEEPVIYIKTRANTRSR